MSGCDEKADGEPLNSEPLKPLSEELIKESLSKPPAPRRASMQKQDFKDHGYTPDCPGCIAIVRGTARQGHSEEC